MNDLRTTDRSCDNCDMGPDCLCGLSRYLKEDRRMVCDPCDWIVPESELADKWQPKTSLLLRRNK